MNLGEDHLHPNDAQLLLHLAVPDLRDHPYHPETTKILIRSHLEKRLLPQLVQFLPVQGQMYTTDIDPKTMKIVVVLVRVAAHLKDADRVHQYDVKKKTSDRKLNHQTRSCLKAIQNQNLLRGQRAGVHQLPRWNHNETMCPRSLSKIRGKQGNMLIAALVQILKTTHENRHLLQRSQKH
jgi:hypothetical protein